MSIRVKHFVFVCCRGRRYDDRRIHDCAFLEQQSFGSKKGIDEGEDALGQFVFLQQAAELEQGRRNGAVSRLKSNPMNPQIAWLS